MCPALASSTTSCEHTSHPPAVLAGVGSGALALTVDGLDCCLDVAKGKGKRLGSARRSGDLRNMVRHDHAIVPDFFVDPQCPDHVHVSIVGEGFLKIEESPFDVAIVDVEDLAPAPKVTDDVEDLRAGLFQHLRHGPLAKVEPVICAGHDVDETLEAINTTQNPMNALEWLSPRHAGVVRMAAHPHLALLGHGYRLFQKVGNAIPHHVFTDRPCHGQRRLLPGFAVNECAITRAPSSLSWISTHDTENG